MKKIVFGGRVEKGEGMASRLGCPTANIAVEQGVIIPGLGVYVGETEFEGQWYPSLICINDGRTGYHLKMEVHLLGQSLDLIGRRIQVVLLQKLRDLVPFPGERIMTDMIQKDMEKARQWFKKQDLESG